MISDRHRIAVAAGNTLTAFGLGTEVCWRGVLRGERALHPIPGLPERDRFDAILSALSMPELPPETRVIFATTLGNAPTERDLSTRFPKGEVLSAACASGSSAICLAASLLRAGLAKRVRVIAADVLGEFVESGFNSLGATDPDGAKPFDKNRAGLTLGEAAAWADFTTVDALDTQPLGFLDGWGQRNDANHLTAPHREARGLVESIRAAQKHCPDKDIISYCAHGTGTRYNDSMELVAAKTVFAEPIPVWSVKGAMGHTLAACGLVETLLCLQALKEKTVPATVGCNEPENGENWITLKQTAIPAGAMLTTNSGFGGINCALILTFFEESAQYA